ncbi:pikachurin-like [Haliotis rufescens]|uniref:pikachurin-like n=1 Tax=Haliotis rufescens TaxID=6454 RepID=UPI001EAF9A22|nr:pikachurin-like [Haliotis rufescens]
MATQSHQYYERLSSLPWICIVTLLCTVAVSEAKHPEKIVAFFQGNCNQSNPCIHECQDIYDGGFICHCREGYVLNKDGMSCSVDQAYVRQQLEHDQHDLGSEVRGDLDKSRDASPSHSNYNIANEVLPGNEKQSQEESNLSQDKGSLLSTDSSHRKTKILDKVDRVGLLPENPEISIKTYDLRKDIPDPISDFHIREGGEHSQNDLMSPEWTEGKGKFKLRPSKTVTCDGMVCQNNGTCVVDANIPRCNCPIGTAGSRCEKVISVVYPKFHGMGYLALPVLKNGYRDFRISMEFRPEAKNGLLLFSAELDDAKTDFFSVALVDGYIEFRFDCGTGIGVLRSLGEVTLGKWNEVTVQREENGAGLQLNEGDIVEGTAQGAFTRITLRLHLFLGGYANMSSITNRIGTAKQYVGCVQELSINGYKYDMRKGEIIGDAQFGLNVGECSEGICDNIVCQNGGSCSPRSADSHVCLCPLGSAGDFCEKRHDVHIPRFSGHSYLQYEGLNRRVLSYTEIEVVFKPMMPDGSILYNGYTKDRKGDFISLALRDGIIEFSFDLGTGPAVIRSHLPVSLDHWHVARASRTGLQGILEVDDQPRSEGEAEGAYTQLTLLEGLFIGGHRNYDEVSKYHNMTNSFVGCIQKVVINKRPVRLMKEMVDGINIEPCSHPCAGEPCMNGGECRPKRDVYTCYCPLGYANTNCEDKMEKLPEKPMFIGTSFLMFTDKRILKRVTGNKIDLQMHILPKGKNGLLFWSGQDAMESSSDFVALGFVDGGLQLRYNLGSGEAVIGYNDSRLYDGQWHFVRAQRDKQDAYLEIDSTEIVEGSAPGSYTVLNTNKILYIGGMPDVSQNSLGKFSSGYVGCMKDVILATDFNIKMMNHAQSGRNIYHCVSNV